MSLETSVVSVTITRQTLFPTRQGFGIPLLLVYHTRTPNLIDYFTSLQGMLDAGFAITDPAYKMAVVAFSQNPHPTSIVVGRRTHATTMIVKLLPKTTTPGFTYSFTYVDATGLATLISYVNGGSETAITIGTALAAAIDALASSAAAVNGGTGEVTVTASVAGVPFNLQNLPYLTDLHVSVTTAANNVVNDYNACKAVDGSTWYGVAIDSNCKAEIEAMAAQIETEKKFFLYETSDSDCADVAITSDVVSDLKTSNYARTGGIFAQREISSYRSVGWLCKGLAAGATNPGGNSWSFLGLNGVAVDNLISDGSLTVIKNKRGNVYINMGGLAQTYSDLVADNEHIDLIVGTDWLYYSLLTDVLGLFYTAANNNSKLPFTDSGAAMIQTAVLARLNSATPSGKGQQATFLADLPAPTCTVPKVATVDPALRAARQLPDVKFAATLAGSINSVIISGTLSV